jgi:alcohol dehydrogenase class IV
MLLPHVFLYNLPEVTSKAENLAKIYKSRAPEDIAEKIWQLLAQFQLPKTLSAIGIKQEELSAIAKESLPSASMAANPKNANFKELMLLLERAF